MVIFVIKIYVETGRLHTRGKETYAVLKANLKKEKIKGNIIDGHMLLANNLEQTLLNRFFEITKKLIRLQKLILHSN